MTYQLNVESFDDMIIDKQSDIIADSVDIQRSVVVETVILLGDCMGVGGGMD